MKAFDLVPTDIPRDADALSLHPDPPAGWHRIAVCSFWSDPAKVRQRYPHASVVGRLRTRSGVDLLLRDLLANPQICLLVLDGQDLEKLSDLLLGLSVASDVEPQDEPQAWRACARSDIIEAVTYMRTALDVVVASVFDAVVRPGLEERGDSPLLVIQDRAEGPLVFRQPRPEVAQGYPSGDPGTRVVGDTLDETWARAVHEVMRFGRDIGTAREVLNLTSVVRNPQQSLADIEAGALCAPLGITLEEVEQYVATQLCAAQAGTAGLSYTYGDRMGAPTDQFERVLGLLRREPTTRAAVLTTWRPEEDSGGSANRPCLTTVWFRGQPDGRGNIVLHLTVTFRSHDLVRAYPKNLAGCCLWLTRWCAELGMIPGTVTCHSASAHAYDVTWEQAEALAARVEGWRDIRWDPRSVWHLTLGADGAFHAVARDPSTQAVVYETTTHSPAELRARIGHSGLVSDVGHALWLGQQIEVLASKVAPR